MATTQVEAHDTVIPLTGQHVKFAAPRQQSSLALTLRQAIRAERARQGLTQEDLAKKLGWTRQVVFPNLESGVPQDVWCYTRTC